MNLPHMLIMRNTAGGSIWQAYEVRDEVERAKLTNSALGNGFIVQSEPVGYTEETTPGWRDTEDWKNYRSGKLTGRALGQSQVREILKDIRRDGPYWLGGYQDWLVSCYSLRSPEDLKGFTPIACWSESDSYQSKQWMVLTKDGEFYVDKNFGGDNRTEYGVFPVKADSIDYPPHIYDWLFKDVIAKHKETK